MGSHRRQRRRRCLGVCSGDEDALANLVFRDVSGLVKATVCGDYSSLRSTTVLRQNMTPTSRAPLAAVFLCGLVCLGANGAVRNRTEDLPIVFPDDNVANGGVGGVRLPPRTARRLIDVAPPPTHSGVSVTTDPTAKTRPRTRAAPGAISLYARRVFTKALGKHAVTGAPGMRL